VTRPQHVTDPGDPDDPSPLSEQEEQQVAALLRDALGRGPVAAPADVVSRLDDVLSGLVAERSAAATQPTGTSKSAVVSLEARRRRLPKVLLAAAAVVVGGYAVGNLALDGSLTGGDGGGAGSADTAGGASADNGGGDGASRSDRQTLEGGLAGANGITRAPVVRRDHLAADVRRVVRLPVPDRDLPVDPDAGVDEARDCPVPRLTDAQRLYEVRYQGGPAGLVVGPRHQGQVDVTVYSCRTGGVELSAAVPAP